MLAFGGKLRQTPERKTLTGLVFDDASQPACIKICLGRTRDVPLQIGGIRDSEFGEQDALGVLNRACCLQRLVQKLARCGELALSGLEYAEPERGPGDPK